MTNSPAAPLAELSIILPFTPRPVANYAPFVIDGDHLYRSGQGPRETDGPLRTGKVGTEASIDQARDDVHLRGVNPLAATQEALSDLGGVRSVIKLLGVANAVPDFFDHPTGFDGYSDPLVEVFGETGGHARSAVGSGSLPNDIAAEIEAIAAFRN